MISYEESIKNQKLGGFIPRNSNPTDEEVVEGIIMDSDGITMKQLRERLKTKHGKIFNKKKIEDIIIRINRSYVDTKGFQVIVYKHDQWIWRAC